jgi:hypothetical protein
MNCIDVNRKTHVQCPFVRAPEFLAAGIEKCRPAAVVFK